MKTNLFVLLFACLHFIVANAAVHTIHVSNFKFTPGAFNTLVGDTVLWVWDEGTHTTTTSAANIPPGADAWDAPVNASNQSFEYVIKVPGDYFYFSKIDADMSGSFTASGTLPVQLLNFSVANTANNKAFINWNTVTEENTAYFSVQRSTDAIKFIEIARLDAEGNSTTIQSYSFTDNNIDNRYKYLYYTIQTVDKDGSKQMADVKTFKNNAAAAKLITTLYPNPVSNPCQLNIQFNADKPGKMIVLLYDEKGNFIKQAAMESAAGLNNRYLPLGNLSAGVYKIVFKLHDITETKTIVVE